MGWWNERLLGENEDGRVVIDRVLPHCRDDEEVRAAFNAATKVAIAMDHPNIVRVHGMAVDDGDDYSWSELLTGVRLDRLLSELQRSRQRLSVNAALLIAQDLGSAVAYASSEGVLHDFIAPSLVQVTQDGRIKLLGFENGRFAKVAQKIGEFPTRDDYLSPEQAKGGERDVRSELFRIGVVLYAALTGAPPFRRKGDVEFFKSLRSEKVTPPSLARKDVPAEVDELVLSLLAKKPEERTQSPDELVKAILQLMEDREHRAARDELADLAAPLDELKPLH